MKKTLLIMLLSLLGMTQAVAQDYEYVPLVREGVKWVYYYENTGDFYPPDPDLAIGKVYLTLELKGDTVIDGKVYKALHKYYGDQINTVSDTVPIYLREEGKIVYGIVPEGVIYPDCPIYCFGNQAISALINDGKEFILYDFNDPVSFCQSYSSMYRENEEAYEITGFNYLKPFKFADVVTINGRPSKRYVFGLLENCCFIEGIGFDGMGDGYLVAFGYDRLMSAPPFCLSHVIEDGEVIYRSAKEVDDKPYLSIAREGVEWVNEHVSVQDGDTTCYYYSYEFKPIENNTRDYHCYFNSQDSSNPCADSLVAIGRNWGPDFTSIQNKMLEPIMASGENMINFECTNTAHAIYNLYRFDQPDISPYCLLNYYIGYQKEDVLNRENFVEIEPVEIEGVECSRFAFLGDDGEPLAYVVEGIGFDSRDMGDLLTPFTRQPDPNANHQEWCGLSHVIKDGQIIYKGMRYRHGAFTGIDEVVADGARRPLDPHYYNLMGQPVGHDVPTTPGIYIHQGKKIVVR